MAKNDFKEGFNKGQREGIIKSFGSVIEQDIQRDILDNYNIIINEYLKDGDVITIFDGKITFVMKDGKLQA